MPTRLAVAVALASVGLCSAWIRPQLAGLGLARRSSANAARLHSAATSEDTKWALLFDCDGVIVETEELHRLAYNGAFDAFGLEIDGEKVNWSVPYYDKLQNTVGGGKPKMRYHFTTTAQAWPECTAEGEVRAVPVTDEEQTELIDDLQNKKTEIYKTLVETTAEARPGVLDLMDAALACPDVAVGICSAATRAGFEKVVDSVVGKERLDAMDIVIAGDDISNKKPDPEIYNVARSRLGIDDPSRCVVIEDSLVGLRAAKSANMRCIVTYTASTESVDFYKEGADAKIPDLHQGAVSLGAIFDPLRAGSQELLESTRDPQDPMKHLRDIIMGRA